jgi:2-polyprenyl-6-methoxyphenol hydroxylase-like FAD-dependent oxidoreductase
MGAGGAGSGGGFWVVVLIIGGGVAGAAAALALGKAGIEVSVYEAHPGSGEDIGAFLTLASNGMLALAQVGAAGVVAEAGFPLRMMRVTSDTGAEIAVTPLGEHGNPLARYRCLRRAELGTALQSEALRRGIAIRYGKRLDSVTEDGDGISARFSDGSTARGDLLIGADGLNSAARSLIDPAAAPPRYAGPRIFYGYTRDATPPGEPERIEMIRGSTAAFGYAVSPSGETYWFARVPGGELPAGEIAGTTPAQWREGLVPLLRRDATPAAGIVAATGDQLLVTNAHDLPAVTRWRTRRMLIIGDAAHAASPATGQGASMALEDAVVLAKALRDAGTTDAALGTYERLRRPRVERNIATSARMTTSTMPNRIQRALRNYRARLLPTRRPSPAEDSELMRQLDWDTPLPS